MTQTASLKLTVDSLFLTLRKALSQELGQCAIPVSPTQMMAMMIISHQPGISPAELANKLARDRAVVTRVLARFTRLNWIERSTDPDDARRQSLTLSPVGEVAFSVIQQTSERVHSRVFGPLSENEKKQLQALISKCL